MFLSKMWKARQRPLHPLRDRRSQRGRVAQRVPLFLETLEDRTLLTAWTALGPAPLPGEGLAGNSNSGRITGIAADPNNANIAYIAAAGGGIWKTSDAQDANPKWIPLTDNIPGTTASMGAIAIAPSNANVLYAGTGEANAGLVSNYGEGILVSTDGGSSWTLENPGGIFTGLTVAKIDVNPTNAKIAYAAIGNLGWNREHFPGTGIYKTSDGGATWTNTTKAITTSASFTDVVLDPKNPSTLYAAVGPWYGTDANGIYKSTDGGSSWSLLANFPHGAGDGRIALAISATNPSVLYAVTEAPSTGALAAMEVSTDAGNTWTNLPNTPNFVGDGGWYDLTIAVDPSNAAFVYAAGSRNGDGAGEIESTDGGANWTSIDLDDNRAAPHSDDHALVFDANNHLLMGTDGGIYRKDSDPQNANGFLWTDLNGNLNTIQFYSVSINASNGNILGGTQDNAAALYTSTKGTWNATGGGDVGRIAFASDTRAYEFAAGEDSGTAAFIRVSNDGGKTWSVATNGLNDSDPMNNFFVGFAVDANNPDRAIFGSNQLYQTTNAAGSWTKLTATGVNGWNPKGNPVDTVAMAASEGNTIYAATGGDSASASQVFVSSDGGGTWAERDLPTGSGRVNQILVDPTNAQTAYAVISTFGGGHVFKTIDGGKTWTNISGNLPDLPTWSIQVDTTHDVLFVGNDQSVYASTDGGTTWSRFGNGLANAKVYSLDYNAKRNTLVAGTYGRGAWQIAVFNEAPTVTINPINQTVTEGQAATFTASADGNPTPTVQWQVSSDGGKTFSNLSGATSTTLTLTNTTFALSGNEYRAVFTNSIGSATTSAATLTVQTVPVVTTNPTDQTVMEGQTATFTAAASGHPAPTVQWQVSSDGGRNFSNLSSATSATLTLTNVNFAMTGNKYRAVFTNGAGSATSSAATLTVTIATGAPVITSNPVNQTVTAGQTATFTASAKGTPTPTVQWQVSSDGGNSFTNLLGATSPTLLLVNVTTAMSGNEYRALFANSTGNATSSAATLTVTGAAGAPVITANPSNQTVAAGQTATFTAEASGTPTVQWQGSTDGGTSFSDLSGATSATLTLTNVATAMTGNEYRAVFTNSAGSATSSAATLTVTTAAGAPVITANPTSQTVTAGQTATLTASASGDPPLSVQWQLSSDGGTSFRDLSGATSTTLTLSNVTTAVNGNEYRALFTNNIGSATTSAATLTVNGTPAITSNPISQMVTAGSEVTFTASANGNPAPTVQWQLSTDGGNSFSDLSGATSTTLKLTNVTFAMNGNAYRTVFTNSFGSATTSAAVLTVQTPPLVTTNPSNQTVAVGQSATFTASAGGNPPPTVQWQVSSDGGKTFTNVFRAQSPTLTLSNVQPSQNGFLYRAVFTNSVGAATTTAATLLVQIAPAFVSGNSTAFTVGQSGSFTVSVTGSPPPLLAASGPLPSGVTFTDNGNGTATVGGVPAAGTRGTYRITITAHNGVGSDAVQNFTLTVNSVSVPPPAPPPEPHALPALKVPPLLAFFNSLLGGVETVNANGTETIVDSLFGFPLLVSTFDAQGNLVSVTLFGFNVTFLFG